MPLLEVEVSHARTSLAANAPAGSASIQVNSQTGFTVSDQIQIGTINNTERNQIISLGGSGPPYTWSLAYALSYNHNATEGVLGWTPVNESRFGPVEVKRSARGSTAILIVNDATVSDRHLFRQGRLIHVTLRPPDGSIIRFAGYILRHVVEVIAPQRYRLRVECVGLEHGATLVRYGVKQFPAGTLYTNALSTAWSELWPDVWRDIYPSSLSAPDDEALQFRYSTLAEVTDYIAKNYLGYLFWMEWDGSDNIMHAIPRYALPLEDDVLTENDIGYRFEVSPYNDDVRTVVTVVGDRLPDGSTAVGFYQDTDAVNYYGARELTLNDADAKTPEVAQDRAEAIGKYEKAWPFWQMNLSVRKFNLKPGNRVRVYIPSLGIDNTNFRWHFFVEEVLDRLVQGQFYRELHLVEAR